jgi:protein-tyrosine phosphatase
MKNGQLKHPNTLIPDYLYIPAEDDPSFDIAYYFDLSFKFIEATRSKTNILIHCESGTNRSITILIAYLIRKYKFTYDFLYSFIEDKKASVINLLFRSIQIKDLLKC